MLNQNRKIICCNKIPQLFFSVTLVVSAANVSGQNPDKYMASPVYTFNKFSSGIIILTGFTFNAIGLKILDKKSITPEPEIISLSQNDVNSFDRKAFRQDADRFSQAQNVSDILMNVTLFAPFALLVDRKIRYDWIDYSLLYLKTQAIAANMYAWGLPHIIDRKRPFLYYSEIPFSAKTGKRTNNSFFSGHVSSTATASFFMAKVYTDYHPDKNKLLIYSLASIPPAMVGLYRIKAGKHFPTDVITGYIIGAVAGIIIPQLHRSKKERNNHRLK